MTANDVVIENRIQFLLKTGQFLETLSLVQQRESSDAQDSFINILKEVCTTLREIFLDASLIKNCNYNGGDFWPRMHGKRIGFVDGGVARIEIPSSAPIGIRVGTYSVECGSSDKNREKFDFKTFIVDELYGSGGHSFIETNDDVSKMADCSRIIALRCWKPWMSFCF